MQIGNHICLFSNSWNSFGFDRLEIDKSNCPVVTVSAGGIKVNLEAAQAPNLLWTLV